MNVIDWQLTRTRDRKFKLCYKKYRNLIGGVQILTVADV